MEYFTSISFRVNKLQKNRTKDSTDFKSSNRTPHLQTVIVTFFTNSRVKIDWFTATTRAKQKKGIVKNERFAQMANQ